MSDTMTPTNVYHIDSLKGVENNAIWKIRMKDILMDMRLWEIVNKGSKSMRRDNTRVSRGVGEEEVDQTVIAEPSSKVEQSIWERKDEKAQIIIQMHVSNSILVHIKQAMPSKMTWDIL